MYVALEMASHGGLFGSLSCLPKHYLGGFRGVRFFFHYEIGQGIPCRAWIQSGQDS